ncbi:MAG: carbohydrate kinase family protein [Nitrososphaerales archaeon]
MPAPVVVIADLIADLAMHIPAFPVQATDLTRVTYLQLGPGGACNTAIMAARLGLPVMCLGELGYDAFGDAVLEGLRSEGIDCGHIAVGPAVRTPVAGVIVDGSGEPAYLGYRGELRIGSLLPAWRDEIRAACALFADGWAENEGVGNLVLEAFHEAAAAGVPSFFDPGPGNPAVNNEWHKDVVRLAHVVLANEKEAMRLTGASDALSAGQAFIASGAELAVVKRDVAGCLLVTGDQFEIAPGYPVPVVDATGAGDSLAAGIIFGHLNGLSLANLGVLANAIGAAKVQKRGTGLNVPTRPEVQAVLLRFSEDGEILNAQGTANPCRSTPQTPRKRYIDATAD